MKRIYICGQMYSGGKIEENVDEAFRLAAEILAAGHNPIIPHLLHHFDQWQRRNYAVPLSEQTYLDKDLSDIETCNYVVCLNSAFHPNAKNCHAEMQFANSLGIQVVSRHELFTYLKEPEDE